MQLNRTRNGDDRFYSAAKARRSHNSLRRAQSDAGSWRSRRDEPAPAAESSSLCNLERFLESVAPSVQAQYLSKVMIFC